MFPRCLADVSSVSIREITLDKGINAREWRRGNTERRREKERERIHELVGRTIGSGGD